MSSSIFSPPNPSAIGLRRNPGNTGVPRYPAGSPPSGQSSAHSSRPGTSDGNHGTSPSHHTIHWRSSSDTTSGAAGGHMAAGNDGNGDMNDAMSPRKRRPLMVSSRNVAPAAAPAASRPYPFMSAQAHDSIPWLLEHKERPFVAADHDQSGEMKTTDDDGLDGGGYIMRAGSHAGGITGGRSSLASSGAVMMISPPCTAHSHRSIGHGWSSPRSAMTPLSTKSSSSHYNQPVTHHSLAYPAPPTAPYPNNSLYGYPHGHLTSPPSSSYGSQTARQHRLPALSRSVELSSSVSFDSRPTTSYSSSSHSSTAGILSPRAPSSEPFSTQPSQVSTARRHRSRAAVRQAALADVREANAATSPRRGQRSASLSYVAAAATGATGLNGLDRQGHTWAMRPSCYVESHSAANWKTRHDQLQHYFHEMERQKERRRAIAAIEEEKWLTEIENSWRLELDELKKRKAVEAVEDQHRAAEEELMHQADEEKQWHDMERRITAAKGRAADEHASRMEHQRLEQVRLLAEEKKRASDAAAQALYDRNRAIDRDVKKTMSRMLDILVETSRQAGEEKKRRYEAQRKQEAMELSVMMMADRDKAADDVAKLARARDAEAKRLRDIDDKKLHDDNEAKKKLDDELRLARGIADAKLKFESDAAAAEAKKKADADAEAARVAAAKAEANDAAHAHEQRLSAFAAVFADKRSKESNADQAARDAIEQKRLDECAQMKHADDERHHQLADKKAKEEKSRRQEVSEMNDAEAERNRDIINEATRKREEAESRDRAERKQREMLLARYHNAFAYKRAIEESDAEEAARLRRLANEAAAAAEDERLRLEREAADKAGADEAERKRREGEVAEAARRAAADEAERKRRAEEERLIEEARKKAEQDAADAARNKNKAGPSKACIIL